MLAKANAKTIQLGKFEAIEGDLIDFLRWDDHTAYKAPARIHKWDDEDVARCLTYPNTTKAIRRRWRSLVTGPRMPQMWCLLVSGLIELHPNEPSELISQCLT
jgi:hypothetical protein